MSKARITAAIFSYVSTIDFLIGMTIISVPLLNLASSFNLERKRQMTELDPRNPAVSVPIYRHSGTMVPAPKGKSDGNAGGQIPPSQYSNKPNSGSKQP